MIRKFRRVLLVSLLIIVLPLGLYPSIAQSEGQRYFPESGHWVTGDFLKTFESATDPISIFGYPIVDAFQNPTTGRIVQYFQRAYFELHTENPPELRVQMILLGEILYKPGNKVIKIPPQLSACRYFPETDRQVCYAFKDFFEANGGVGQFGFPISEIEIQNGRLVQYFQRACFEWHPERPEGQRVRLSDLGMRYFTERNEDPSRLRPNKERYIPQSILGIHINAFVSKPVIPPTETQTVYAIVQDQNFYPISNAKVVLTIRYPSGEEIRLPIPDLTDEHGITKWPFRIEKQDKGLVEVQVTVSYDTFEETTRTSFRIWW